MEDIENKYVNVFDYNEDINKTAYMNWRTDQREPIQNFNVLADGYFQSSLILIDECLKDNYDKKADCVIFPILFNFNHGIELAEKSIICSLKLLKGDKFKIKQSHNIQQLWNTTKQKIIEFGFDYGRPESSFIQMSLMIEGYIKELYDLIEDKDGKIHFDFPRYPLDQKDDDQFYIKELNNVCVDLEAFKKVILDISKSLMAFSTYYYQILLDKWEAQADL